MGWPSSLTRWAAMHTYQGCDMYRISVGHKSNNRTRRYSVTHVMPLAIISNNLQNKRLVTSQSVMLNFGLFYFYVYLFEQKWFFLEILCHLLCLDPRLVYTVILLRHVCKNLYPFYLLIS